MRVLSWDVGLRTLSYCLIEADVASEDKHFNIVEWDSIDVHVDGVNGEGVNDAVSVSAVLGSMVAVPVLTKKGSGVGRAAKRVKTAAVSIEEGARLILDALHRRHDMLIDKVDAVVIEQQPAGGHNQHSNVRMKVMSHAIHCYFYSRNISATPPRHTPITFVPASSKFEEKTKEPKTKRRPVAAVESPTESSDKSGAESVIESVVESASSATGPSLHTQYSKNKKYAVEKTGELLRDGLATTDRSRIFFESTSTKKKDDLADSFLLGYYFLSKQRAAKMITATVVKTEKKPRKRKSDGAANAGTETATVVGDGAQKPEKKPRKRKSDVVPNVVTDVVPDAVPDAVPNAVPNAATVFDVLTAGNAGTANSASNNTQKPEKKQRKRKTDQPLET